MAGFFYFLIHAFAEARPPMTTQDFGRRQNSKKTCNLEAVAAIPMAMFFIDNGLLLT